jgi:hypothetical protein
MVSVEMILSSFTVYTENFGKQAFIVASRRKA